MSVPYCALLQVSEHTVSLVAEKLKEQFVRTPKLPYFDIAIVGLLYMAEHKTLTQLKDEFGISVGGAYNYTTVVRQVLAALLDPGLTDLVGALHNHDHVVLDGTSFTFTQKYKQGFYTKKKGNSCVNVQFITDLSGSVLWFSPALPGATHDTKACKTFDVAGAAAATGTVVYADKGYVGAGVDGFGTDHGTICNISRVYRHTSQGVKDSNRIISRIRRVVETPFSRLKNWKILTKCRMHLSRGLGRVDTMLQAVVSLHLLEGKSW